MPFQKDMQPDKATQSRSSGGKYLTHDLRHRPTHCMIIATVSHIVDPEQPIATATTQKNYIAVAISVPL